MNASFDWAKAEPFEICSIRPPTENCSLTFRLTRNCAWNRCLFCPAYKYGARFSRRSLGEIKRDVDRAKAIDDLLSARDVRPGLFSDQGYRKAAKLIEEIRRSSEQSEAEKGQNSGESKKDEVADERIAWFASWFKQKSTLEDSVHHVLSWKLGGQETCFLGDANGFLLSPEFFAEALAYIREAFPTLRRFTIYGRTHSAAKKKIEDLAAFAQAGLHRVHFGIESGSDTVLSYMTKGATAADHIEACRKTKEVGLSPSVYVMPGLGGVKWSTEHAAETARVLSRCAPDLVRLRSLEIFPGTGLAAAVERGEFLEASEEQVVREIRVLVEQTEAATVIMSDSASNLLAVNGKLPEDRPRMLDVIDDYLSIYPRGKLAFSLQSRLQSFIGQYGGLTDDILQAIGPCIAGSRVDISRVPDDAVERMIRLIRSKLMP